MRVRWYVVPTFAIAVAGMALSGCSDPGAPSTPESSQSESASAEKTAEPVSKESEKPGDTTTVSFKEAVEYEDGVKVEIAKIQQGKIGQYASGGKTGGNKTTFTIRITNSSEEAYDATLLSTPSVTYGDAGTTVEAVYDSSEDSANVNGGFRGKILPGKSMSADWAFAIPKEELGNVTLQLEMDIMGTKEPAIFTGSAQ